MPASRFARFLLGPAPSLLVPEPFLFVLAACLLAPFFGSFAAAQSRPPIYAYRAFSVIDQANLEQTLSRNGAEGYRLVGLSKGLNGELNAVMEKAATPGSYQYKVIFGAWAHLRMVHNGAPIVDLLNEAGRQGFRLVPNSVLASNEPVSAAVVVEHAPDSDARYEYRIDSPQVPTAAKFARDFAEGQKDGFSLVFYGTAGRGVSTLMEKQDPASAPAAAQAGDYRRLECTPKDLVARLGELVDQGYVPFAISPWEDFTAIKASFWLEKTTGLKLRMVSAESKPGGEMALLRVAYEGLTKELNQASADGYSLVALPIICRGLHGSFLAKFTWRLVAVLRQGPGSVTYRLAEGDSLPEMNAEMNAAAGEGFRVIPGSMIAGTAILMELTCAPSK